jgi:hypothetical protein
MLLASGVAAPARAQVDSMSVDSVATVETVVIDTAAVAADEQTALQELVRVSADIQALLDGSLPEGFVVQTLFAVDLLDESAVERRRNDLRLAMQNRNSQLASADSAQAGALRAANQADGLRLQFLSRPLEERARVNQAEKSRRELKREKEVAARTRQEAEERATAAEAQRQSAIADAQRKQSAVLEDLAQEMVRVQTIRATSLRSRGIIPTWR